MAHLFSPLKIKNIELKNRIAVSPMCEYSSEDGFANDWHLIHLGSRAVGGAALIITEACAVSPEGRITYADLGIYSDEHVEKLKHITNFIHEHGAVAGVQLAHAGRKASHEKPWKGNKQIPSDQHNGWKAVAPSAIPFIESEEAPLELDKAGIEKIKADFKAAAQRAIAAGFKLIELHGAHGYLLHQFLSPISNKRTDEYGGSFDNRIRLLLEVLESVICYRATKTSYQIVPDHILIDPGLFYRSVVSLISVDYCTGLGVVPEQCQSDQLFLVQKHVYLPGF